MQRLFAAMQAFALPWQRLRGNWELPDLESITRPMRSLPREDRSRLARTEKPDGRILRPQELDLRMAGIRERSP